MSGDIEKNKDSEATEAHTENVNLFVDSVNELTPGELGPERVDPKRNKKLVMKAVRIAVLAVLGTVFIVSLLTVLNSLRGYERGQDIYEPIAENVFNTFLGGERDVSLSPKLKRSPALLDYTASLTADTEETVEQTEPENSLRFEIVKSNLNYFKSVNPDIYGYINADGTKISYPIVQGEDNDYYLNRAWNGEYVVVGSIYADYRAEADVTSKRNTVFYGHNMNDGSMFNNVVDFLDKEVFDNTLIEIYTFDGIYIYQPISVYKTVNTDQYFRMDFSDDADFLAFCDKIKAKSEVECDISVDADDTMITLSTCTPDDDVEYAFRGRYALHAKLIRVEH